jgi:glutathione S-transferase
MSSAELKLFYFPRACSLAVHIVLEESGMAYERSIVDLRTGQNREADYLSLNPNGAVPALRIGRQTLTETHAILTYLGDEAPKLKLLPPLNSFLRYRAHEWMNFLSSGLHTYIRSIFRSSVYAGQDTQVNASVKAQGVSNLAKAVATIENRLEDHQWALGEQFSVVDAYLFVMFL